MQISAAAMSNDALYHMLIFSIEKTSGPVSISKNVFFTYIFLQNALKVKKYKQFRGVGSYIIRNKDSLDTDLYFY